MILNETVAAIADAIREKTGKSELIKPIDFATEIKSISAGGGESGGSDWHYFDVSALDLTDPSIVFPLIMSYMTIKFAANDEVMVGPFGLYEMYQDMAGGNIKTLAFGVDYTQRVIYNGKDSSYGEGIEEVKAQGISLTEITKEQFYDLNA